MTAEVPLKIYQKYVAEDALLSFDFERFTDAGSGVTISGTPTISVTKQGDVTGSLDADVTVTPANPFTDGLLVAAYFLGGKLGERYLITVKANLSDGQVPREIHIFIYIKRV